MKIELTEDQVELLIMVLRNAQFDGEYNRKDADIMRLLITEMEEK